jgi:aspartyl protease family protein
LLLTGYAFRGEIRTAFYRVAGEVLPPGHGLEEPDAAAGERSVRMRRQSSGHFVARAEVNGQTMSLLVDTGASTVVLKATDAARAGIDTSSLSFTVPVDTANGATFAAPARVARIAIGPIVLEGVEALVAKPGTLKESLLGMSFLRRLRSYEFSGDFLTIRG